MATPETRDATGSEPDQRKDVVMETSQHTPSATPRSARVGIAIGFATIAIAAVMSNASAFTRAAEPSAAIALPASLAVSSDQVDWSRVQPANITPAESVAAYDR
jgi:hypothetical protein